MLKNLILDRPLAAVDIETTGLIPIGAGARPWSPGWPRIVEIAVIRVMPDGQVDALLRRINPGIPMPADAERIHGISDVQLANCPTWLDALPPVLDLLVGSDVTGFNISGFDLPVIQAEMARAGLGLLDFRYRLVIDTMAIFHRYYPPPEGTRGLGGLRAACREYLGDALPGHHNALCDALTALQVLDAQISRHALPARLADLPPELDARPPSNGGAPSNPHSNSAAPAADESASIAAVQNG